MIWTNFIKQSILVVNNGRLSFARMGLSARKRHLQNYVQRQNYSQKRPLYWNIDPRVMETDDWLRLVDGKYRVCPWAVSGVESCIVVSSDDFTIAFDMGYPYPASVKCEHVFISHGHMDHISGIVSHASKRSLYSMPPATYYVPRHLHSTLGTLAENFSKLHERPIKLKLRPVDIDQEIKLPQNIMVKPFPTIHRVPSQGYIVYKVVKKLKPQFVGTASKAIGELVKEGAEIFDIEKIPQVAYTGDTMSEIFHNVHNTDLLKVDLLITESTYVDNEDKVKSTVEKARDRGHMHLDEIIAAEDIFRDIQDILLVHFSDKYTLGYILKQVGAKLPKSMCTKVHLGLTYQRKFDFRK